MRRQRVAVVAALLIGLGAVNAARAKPDARWSPEGRRRILTLTDELEKHPLADDTKKVRTEVMAWWVDVPDVTLNWCSSVLLDGKNEKTKPIVLMQAMFGAGALLLQPAAKAPSEMDVTMAGVRSGLEAYKNAVKSDPSYRDVLYDQLASDPKRLTSYLDIKVEGCRAHQKKTPK